MEEVIIGFFVVGVFLDFLVCILKEYNFFEEEDEEEEVVVGNLFIQLDSLVFNFFSEEDEYFQQRFLSFLVFGNFFEEFICINFFEMDSDSGLEVEEFIEEEFFLQQIDNIKVYIFDVKQCGCLDEVEVLIENLWELKYILVKQKGGID